MIQIFKTIALGLCIFINTFLYAQNTGNRKPVELSINEAIDKGMLEFKICGSYDPQMFHEVFKGDGTHYGKCMAIVLKSKIDSLVVLRLDCGIQLIPIDTSVQTMIVTQKALFPLFPHQTYITKFYAMCGQIHDGAPNIGTTFRIGEMADSGLVKLANYLGNNYTQNMIGQHAVWLLANKVNFDELKRYGADSISIAKTKEILNGLNLGTKETMNTTNPVVIENQPKTKNLVTDETNEITLNRSVFYAGIGLLLIMTTGTIILIFRSNKQGNTIA